MMKICTLVFLMNEAPSAPGLSPLWPNVSTAHLVSVALAPFKTQLVASVSRRCNMKDENNKGKEAHLAMLHNATPPLGCGLNRSIVQPPGWQRRCTLLSFYRLLPRVGLARSSGRHPPSCTVHAYKNYSHPGGLQHELSRKLQP